MSFKYHSQVDELIETFSFARIWTVYRHWNR